MGIAKNTIWAAILGMGLILLASGCGNPLEECNPYKEYDDTLSGRIFERNTTLSAEDILELRLYSFDRDLGLPCQKIRPLLYQLRTIRKKEDLATYIAAVNLANEVEWETTPSPPFGNNLGMEFVTLDGRMTFLTIDIYKDSIVEEPFPINKFAYNKWSFCNDVLYALLKERGILDAMPGYAEFMAAQKQKP